MGGCVSANTNKAPVKHNQPVGNTTAIKNLPVPVVPEPNKQRNSVSWIISDGSRANINEFYEISEKPLGEGGFGVVYHGRRRYSQRTTISSQDLPVAIKVIQKATLKNNVKHLEQELECLRRLDHPNIIKFHEFYQDDQAFYICMEYCAGGELFDRVKQKIRFSEAESAAIITKILKAVNHMHTRGIVHRDLKLDNIMFLDTSEKSELKLIDFGLSAKFTLDQVLTSQVGTPIYASPQVLEGKYDKACDLWSAGVILYMILIGFAPFHGKQNHEVFTKIKQGQFNRQRQEWGQLSDDVQDLIQNLIKVDSHKRFTAKQALNHPWIVRHKQAKLTECNVSDSQDTAATASSQNQTVEKQKNILDSQIVDNLKKYSVGSRFQWEVLRHVVSQLSEEEILNLKESFIAIDVDQSGVITLDELKDVLSYGGYSVSPEEIELIMDRVSQSTEKEEQVINYTQFLAATLDIIQYLQDDKLKDIFEFFDHSGTGIITPSDLQEIFKRNGRYYPIQKIKEIIDEVSPSAEGQISYELFKQILLGESIQN